MTEVEQKSFYKALGFLAALIGDTANPDTARPKAEIYANWIHDFCKTADNETDLPEALYETRRDFWLTYQIIASLKAQFKSSQQMDLPKDRRTKIAILEMLQERLRLAVTKASNDDVSLDAALTHYISEEIKHVESEAEMLIAHIQGDPNAFAAYEHLATTIASLIRKNGHCRKSDVAEMGFSQDELDHWNLAYGLARVDVMAD